MLKLNNRYLIEGYSDELQQSIREVTPIEISKSSYKLKDILNDTFFWEHKSNFKKNKNEVYPGDFLVLEDLGKFSIDKQI